ncbi:hypothetical protein P4O66_003220 [Electrophorus voltai]|uniref:ADAMTS-like protein 2 n=1 Tax=Electrophorus voltai TaxID=2609070 RepID=A0AAD8YR88_9TELE|nr:hypothetical protein P4O66_003220 [Electrophorus voltai]
MVSCLRPGLRYPKGHIQDSREGREELQLQPDEVAQWWGEWSSWSTCSWTCGGGVRSQERHCLQQRLTTTQNINSSFCVGSPKRYQLCTNQWNTHHCQLPCPNSRISFKQHQCSQFNAKAFSRKQYEWVPLYPDDYVSISNKPCDLQCTTTTGERQLLVPAHDGTFCRNGAYQGVCIEGQCQVVGCDGKLYSSKTVDKCGVCGGKGDSCHRISGSYRKGITQLGYAFITNIPVGATDIQIIERRKTENILALSDEDGHFFFNGNTMIDNPRNFHIAGTVFKYRRPANLFSDGFEYIIAQGPTHEGLKVMFCNFFPLWLKYYNLNGKMPHITYEYTVPRAAELRVSPPASSTPDHPPPSSIRAAAAPLAPAVARPAANASSPELPVTGNEIEGSGACRNLSSASTLKESAEAHRSHKDTQPELQVSPDLGEQPQVLRFRPGDPSRKAFRNELESSTHRSEVQVTFGSDSNLIESDSSSVNNTQPAILASVTHGFLAQASGPQQPCQENPTLPECAVLRLNSSTSLDNSLALEMFPGSLDVPISEGEPEAWQKGADPEANSTTPRRGQLVLLHQVDPVQVPHTERNAEKHKDLFYLIRKTRISTSYALCVKYDGSEVDESYCDSLTRPEPTHEFCTGKECPPRWETSRWSECSRTCGEGFQFRTVRCWKMMAPGFDSSAYDELCHASELQKPMARKACRSKSCGPQWEVADWSELAGWVQIAYSTTAVLLLACSARCGGSGLQSREVRCSMEDSLCNESTRPLGQRECKGPPCDRRWSVSDWGPCSGPCGEGRMKRYVACKNANGRLIAESQCDRDLKPLAVQPCGNRDCPAHWVEQEWEQCNATCGRGVKTRQVVCAGLEAGIFKEYPEPMCAGSSPKPEERTACFERPCSKWFSTSWSQCSKTCGSGVRVREVKCYQAGEISHSCDSTLKPQDRQSCEVKACPIEAPVQINYAGRTA